MAARAPQVWQWCPVPQPSGPSSALTQDRSSPGRRPTKFGFFRLKQIQQGLIGCHDLSLVIENHDGIGDGADHLTKEVGLVDLADQGIKSLMTVASGWREIGFDRSRGHGEPPFGETVLDRLRVPLS